ncbi:MAG: hypothetical protein AAF936_05085 [Pseudomonadota bacterium]
MKRPHRRAHLIIWIMLAPITALAAVYFWTMRPATPTSDLPGIIQTSSSVEK